jgi:hypothetical protein
VRPGQPLSSEDFEVLEDLGLLVVQVPPSVPSDRVAVAKYLTLQLRAGSKATEDRMVALSTWGADSDATAPGGTRAKKNEAQLLELLNSPENQLGSLM